MKAVRYSLLSMCLLCAPALGRQGSASKQNPLISGKLIYVGSMPQNIDAWIVHDLQAWGKYKPTRDPEGVDLVMKADEPETKTRYKMRHGIPQPKEVKKKRDHKPVMFSISVTDWVTGNAVWQADVLDRKPKRNQPVAPSEGAEIDGRGLSNQQLAQAITRAFRRYTEHLASQTGP